MSEITRYEVELSDNRCDCGGARGLNEVECANGDYVRHADHLIYLREMRMDRDVERLRADTAEAESARKDKVIEDMVESNSDMTTCLAAAEQRIADQLKLIAGLVEYADNLLSDVNNAWQYAGSTGAPETHRDKDYVAAVAMIAALNPNPEA